MPSMFTKVNFHRAAYKSTDFRFRHPEVTGWVAALGVYTAAMCLWLNVLLWQWGSAFWTVPKPFIGDWMADVFAFEQFPRAVLAGHWPLFTHLLNYPIGVNLTWTALNYAWSLLIYPVTQIFGVIAAYNTLIFVISITNGLAMYWAGRQLTDKKSAAIVGGLIYMFSPYAVGQNMLSHLNLMAIWTIPVAWVLLYDLLHRHTYSPRRIGVALGFLIVIQAFTCEEILLVISVAGAIWMAVWVACHIFTNDLNARPLFKALLWGAPPVVLGVGPLLYAQLTVMPLHGYLYNPLQYVSSPVAWFLPGIFVQFTLPAIKLAVNNLVFAPAETSTYIGLPFIVIAWMLWKQERVVARVLVVVVAISLLLTLGLLGYVSIFPIKDMLPVRLSVLEYFAISLAVVIFCDSSVIKKWQRWLLVGALCLSWVPTQLVALSPALPRFFTHYPASYTNQALLVLPFAQLASTSVSQYWQAVAGDRFAMTGGYYAARGNLQPRYFATGPTVTALTADFYSMTAYGILIVPRDRVHSLSSYIQQHHVSAIVVGPEPHENLVRDTIAYWMGKQPRFIEGVWVWSIRRPG